MQITIQYESQARRAAGIGSETIDVAESSSVGDCIRAVANAHGEKLKPILVDSDGEIQATLLVFLNDNQIIRDADRPLAAGDVLTLMTPISGG